LRYIVNKLSFTDAIKKTVIEFNELPFFIIYYLMVR